MNAGGGLRRKPVTRCARTGDQDVDEAAGTRLPARYSRGVEDADQRTHEVIGVEVGAKIAAGDGALDGGDEGAVDQRARTFDKAHGAAGNGVHCGNDERLRGDVVNE